MSDGDRKEPGKSRDVEELKARLGLKVQRRAPAVAPAPPPQPGPPATPTPPAAPQVEAPRPAAVPAAAAPQPSGAPPAAAPQTVAAPPARPRYEPFVVPEAEPPPPKTAWQKWGRPAVYFLIPAFMGLVVGYVYGKGTARGAMLAKVKEDAGKILAVVRAAYEHVEAIASAVDPAYAQARRSGKGELPEVTAVQRGRVDWASIEALERASAPQDLETIFETDYKRFTRATVKRLTGFFVDFTRLVQLVRDHVAATKGERASLEAESRAGAGPRLYGVMSRALPGLDEGEVVIVRGHRMVKKGNEEVSVFDVLRRADPGRPIPVPGKSLILLRAPGLFKDTGALLLEYNRRSREIVDLVRRLFAVRRSLLFDLEKIAEIQV